MSPATLDAIKALLRSDPTIPPRDRQLIAVAAQNHGATTTRPETAAPKIISRAEAGNRLNRSPRAVDLLADQGHLQRVKMPGRVRNCGFRLADVEALIQGGAL